MLMSHLGLKESNRSQDASTEVTPIKTLPIVWQRLVSSEGKTCDRCSATNREMQRAVAKLKEALSPLGIEPTLETREIDEHAFKANPSESNRIWIAGRPMEEWLGGRVGSSRCCSVCGESECRTVEGCLARFLSVSGPGERELMPGLITRVCSHC